MRFSVGQKILYNARSGKLYPATVFEVKRSFSGGFTPKPAGFYYVIEINTSHSSHKILCMPNELIWEEPHVNAKTIPSAFQHYDTRTKQKKIKTFDSDLLS